MTKAEETATFIPTGKTIVHRGREYGIYLAPPGEDRVDSPWILRSSRDRWYSLMRNRPNPKVLFAVGLYAGALKCLPGWFTDKNKDGTDCELRSLG